MINIGLCLADLNPQTYGDGSNRRTASAINFAGHYKLVDFMLSNMVNSGIYSIALVLGSQYQSLLNHIGAAREWDLARSSGGIQFFPQYPGRERRSSDIKDEPLQRALGYVDATKTDDVIVVDGSAAYNIDFNEPLALHSATGADVTAIYKKRPILEIEQNHAISYMIDKNGRLNEIIFAPPAGEMINLSIGAYIVKKSVLLRMLARERFCDMSKFSCDILADSLKTLNVMAWEYEGHYARISSLQTFYNFNLDMLDPQIRGSLFYANGRRIHTKVHHSETTKYGKEADVRNSLVSNGCQIEGKVENCVLFRNVKVMEGAVVRNSVLQANTVIGAKAELNCIVTDRRVIITDGRTLLGYKTHPVYIEVGKIV